MNNLVGKTILIGKEPGQGRLLVAVQGLPKTGVIGGAGSVPASVSRCKPEEGVAHCKITVAADGSMTITNMKPQNMTYVDGMEVVSKRITTASQVTLGMDRYPISVATILQVAEKLVPVAPPPPKEYSIRHLEAVWERYHSGTIAMRKRDREMAASQSLPSILTIGSGAISGVAGMMGFMTVTFITVPLTIFGIILMIRNYMRRKNDTSVEDGERLLAELQRDYVCPNPECHHFMGMQSYNILHQTKKCPYCGAIFKEK